MNAVETVEVGLGSIGRVKILKALTEEPRMLTIYALQKKTRLKRGRYQEEFPGPQIHRLGK